MGVSTDAILVYGIAIHEDGNDKFDYEDDENVEPSALYKIMCDPSDICVEVHCSDSHPMHIVGLTRTRHTAWRGFPKAVSGLPEISDEENAKLRSFLAEQGLEPDPEVNGGEPGWLLASWWG